MTAEQRDRWLVAGLAGGYLLLVAETILAHADVLAATAVAATGPAAAALLLILSSAAALGRRAAWRTALRWGSLAAVLVGLAGTALHLSECLEHGFFATRLQMPPVLAPLAFCGLGLFGALLTWPAAGQPT